MSGMRSQIIFEIIGCKKVMKEWDKEDLAYIHDVGHSDYALKLAPFILKILAQKGFSCFGFAPSFGCCEVRECGDRISICGNCGN